MLFSEIYGNYYNAVAAVLRRAAEGNLTGKALRKTVQEEAYVVSINGTTTGIEEVTTDSDASDTPVYNLRGQRLTAPQKGINIIGGKKLVVK